MAEKMGSLCGGGKVAGGSKAAVRGPWPGLSELRKPLSPARKSVSRGSDTACAPSAMRRRAACALFLAKAKMVHEEAQWLGLAALGLLIALIVALALTVSAS